MKPELNEVASSQDGRDITRGYVDPLRVQPPDDTVLMQRGGGDFALYREVLRDDHVKAALQQRINAVTSRPWEVRPGGDKRIDKQAAAFLETNLNALRWDAITEKMLHGVFYGYAVAEIMWGIEAGRVVVADIKVRDRRRFGFDGDNRLRLKTMAQPMGELLPERKFWHFATGADHDDAPYGLGLAHWLYWPVWLKRNGLKFWAVFLEKFGQPTAVGKFQPGVSAADQAKLLAALEAIQRDAAIIYPEGMSVELLEAKRGGTADHEAFVRAMNAAILVITIGQTASTQGTPGKLGNDDNQGEVRADISKADADLICMSFSASVAAWLTAYNFPGAATPSVWRLMEEEDDLNTKAERDSKIAGLGFKPSLQYIHDTYGGEWIEAAAPAAVGRMSAALSAEQIAADPLSAPAFAEPTTAFPDQDALDAALAALRDGTLSAQAGLAIQPVLRLLRDSKDGPEALGRLADAYPRMDTEALETLLTRMLFAAELIGRLSGLDDSSPINAASMPAPAAVFNAAEPVQPNITVNLPAPNITVNLPEGMLKPEFIVNVAASPAPVLHLPASPAPVVHVAAPVVNVAAPAVNIDNQVVVPPRETVTEIERDAAGNIVRAVQTDSLIQPDNQE